MYLFMYLIDECFLFYFIFLGGGGVLLKKPRFSFNIQTIFTILRQSDV